jgi:YD repeat-containing protein
MTYDYDSKGNMTSKTFWRSGTVQYTAIQYRYNERNEGQYGNLTSEVDGLGHTTTIDYDTATHTFPVTITNAKGHVTTKTWNYWFGKEDTVTDPNGTYTKYEYDPFGRPDTVTNYDSPSQNYIVGHTDTDYHDSVFPRYITTKVLESGSINSGSYVAKEEYLDGLGRTIKVATDGIVNRSHLKSARYLQQHTMITWAVRARFTGRFLMGKLRIHAIMK